ncbi:hypothetical protein ACP4OV_031642 [Aristida adscensionis]
MKEKKEGGGGGKLGRWLAAPVRALSRACDSYVRRMSACAGRMPTHAAGTYGGRGGFTPGSMHAATFSSRSSRRGGGGGGGDDEDVNELVRAMSQKKKQASSGRGEDVAAAVAVPVRSRSVAVGRIDEDAPCEFGADDGVRVGGGAARRPPPAVRRARSVAVGGGGFGAARSAVHG